MINYYCVNCNSRSERLEPSKERSEINPDLLSDQESAAGPRSLTFPSCSAVRRSEQLSPVQTPTLIYTVSGFSDGGQTRKIGFFLSLCFKPVVPKVGGAELWQQINIYIYSSTGDKVINLNQSV